mgnify:CR=1 FL=1
MEHQQLEEKTDVTANSPVFFRTTDGSIAQGGTYMQDSALPHWPGLRCVPQHHLHERFPPGGADSSSVVHLQIEDVESAASAAGMHGNSTTVATAALPQFQPTHRMRGFLAIQNLKHAHQTAFWQLCPVHHVILGPSLTPPPLAAVHGRWWGPPCNSGVLLAWYSLSFELSVVQLLICFLGLASSCNHASVSRVHSSTGS